MDTTTYSASTVINTTGVTVLAFHPPGSSTVMPRVPCTITRRFSSFVIPSQEQCAAKHSPDAIVEDSHPSDQTMNHETALPSQGIRPSIHEHDDAPLDNVTDDQPGSRRAPFLDLQSLSPGKRPAVTAARERGYPYRSALKTTYHADSLHDISARGREKASNLPSVIGSSSRILRSASKRNVCSRDGLLNNRRERSASLEQRPLVVPMNRPSSSSATLPIQDDDEAHGHLEALLANYPAISHLSPLPTTHLDCAPPPDASPLPWRTRVCKPLPDEVGTAIMSWFHSVGETPINQPPDLIHRPELQLGDIFFRELPDRTKPLNYQMWIWTMDDRDTPVWRSIHAGERRADSRMLIVTPRTRQPSWVTPKWCLKNM